MLGRYIFKHKDLQEIPGLQKKAISSMFETKEERELETRLRPSSMPFCSLLVLRDMVLKKQEMDFMFHYYTSIGTLLHEIAQKWFIQNNDVFGDFECLKCNKKVQDSFKQECCGQLMKYNEIELEWNHITGHIDMITVADGKYKINDFKTTSLKKIESDRLKKGTLTNLKYKIQILVYTFIFEQVYEVEMDNPSLIFIARDDPKVFKEVEILYTDAVRDEIGKFIESQIMSFKSARHSLRTKEALHAYKHRACEDLNMYKNGVKDWFYLDCPLKVLCADQTNSKHIEAYFKKEFQCI